MPAARPDPYTDTSRTQRGPYEQTVTNPQGRTPQTQAGTTVYEGAGTDVGHENDGVDPPPHSPNYWKPGRDPYTNGGGGADYIDNQS